MTVIRHNSGDILQAKTDAVVNTVNSVGVMGRGIALQFKEAYPANFKAYAAACRAGEVQPGRMFVFDTGKVTPPRYIINFPTKRHWRGKSRIEDIRSGLEALVEEIRNRKIHSIAIPPLGSGLGGLDWGEVRPLIEKALATLPDVDVELFVPGGKHDGRERNRSTDVPRMTDGRAALVCLIDQYLGALMDPSITLLEIHKLLYFLQATGEPLRLRYSKGYRGPYAENLRHVLREIEGHLITGYRGGADDPEMQISLVPGATEDAKAYLGTKSGTHDRFHRVAKLVEGFETPYGLELLATVHWVVAQDGVADLPGIREATHRWNPRKRQFTPAQIELAVERLRSENWLDSPDSTT